MEEPGGMVTAYEYTELNQLKQATMTRNGVTQTRTWNYTGRLLMSQTLRETGRTAFTYL